MHSYCIFARLFSDRIMSCEMDEEASAGGDLFVLSSDEENFEVVPFSSLVALGNAPVQRACSWWFLCLLGAIR